MSEAPLVFDRLTRFYGRNKALRDLTLTVPRGTIYALLGRNGAGKTTALRCLLGLLLPTRGTVRVLGQDCRHLSPLVRGRVGYVAEDQQLVPWMRVRQLVGFQRATFPAFDGELCRTWLARLGLPSRTRVRSLSRGMRAQLALVLALAPRPELLVMDDPALGLDTVVRREFLEVMIDLIQEEGRTVLLTSHILTDVERVADRVGILDRGVLRVDAPLDELRRRVRRYRIAFEGGMPHVPEVLEVPGLVRARRFRNEMALTVLDGAKAVPEVCGPLGGRAVGEEDLSLEDLFIEYTSGNGKVEVRT